MALDPAASKKTWTLFVGFFVLFGVGLTTSMAIYLWPKGERIGSIALQAPASALELDVASGDVLHFRIDVTVGTSTYPTSARARSDAIYTRLRASTLTLTTGPRTTTCGAYDGKSMSSSGSSSEVTLGGIPVTCTFEGLPPGRHVVTAKVSWAKDAEVHAATLEVRRASSK